MIRSVPALLGALLIGAPLAAQGVGPGISRELAEYRAATLSDIRYELSFRLPAARDSTVRGTATLRVRKSGDGPLILDFAEPGRAGAARVNGRPAAFRAEHGHLVFPREAVPAGDLEIRLEFVAADAPLNRRDEFLYTLFVPDRAHEAFPSFDQPDLKGRFTLELTAPAGWAAVANGALLEEREEDGVVVRRFAETAPIPTYLFAFAAGRFEVEEAEREGRTLRMLHRETDAEKVGRNRDAIFDLHAAALRWLEEYTGIPYPFGKFDFVAIPSFQYNGMEHPGAILYRASSLFLDESATRNEELGRASVIAHETAHMWFGDLVTMPWFDDVWMKEVFANLMAAKIVNPSFPDIDHDLRFLLAHYPSAYDVDRTAGANPIRQPLGNLADAGSLYGAIIYQKAPIVMRHLERLAGEDRFRDALRLYLSAHAFGNAGWPELVRALSAVAPLDVPAWSRVWIEEPGRPTVRVHLPEAHAEVSLTQEDPRGRGLVWDQVLTVRALSPGGSDGDAEWAQAAVRLEAPRVDFPLPHPTGSGAARPDVVLPNGAGLGYGLFMLDEGSERWLLEGLTRLPDALTRAVSWLDLWEMMLEGAVPVGALADLAREVAVAEPDELLAQQVLGDLSELFWRYLPPPERAARAAGLERVLWARMADVDDTSLKAAYFNAWRSIATTPEAVDRMRRIWSGDLEVEGLPLSERDLTTLALELAVREVPAADSILDAQRERIENPDRRERFDFIRPAVAADPAVRDSFFASLSDVENRRREAWVVTALSYLHHPLRAAASRPYLRPALDLLREVHATGDIFFPTRWLSASLRGHATPEAAEVVRAFIAEHPDYPPRLMGKLLQEADPLFRAVRLRESGGGDEGGATGDAARE